MIPIRQFITLVLLFWGCQTNAEVPIFGLTMGYSIDSVVSNPNLSPDKSIVHVQVVNENFSQGDKILYGYDGNGFKIKLDDQNSFEFELPFGDHFFQFYARKNEKYNEITTSQIKLDSQTTTFISVYFRVTAETPIHVRKPVIYLYPTEETDVSISIQTDGELRFTYPDYQNEWEFTALPSGELLIDENRYNYLFWEADFSSKALVLDTFTGVHVKKQNLVSFLENSLDQFGFTSKEKMDFITYWAPQMLKHQITEVRFIYNETCSIFADLKINPKPDNLLRFYMIWNPVEGAIKDTLAIHHVPTSTRSGFTVLEWGGMEVTKSCHLQNLVNGAERME